MSADNRQKYEYMDLTKREKDVLEIIKSILIKNDDASDYRKFISIFVNAHNDIMSKIFVYQRQERGRE